jgi:protoporphyrin/coproporphyrin ferrochelatase
MTTFSDRIDSVIGIAKDFDPRRDTWGVLYINMGGPESTDQIKPYLRNIFSDSAIIKLPLSFLLQKPLAYLISLLRTPKVAARYNLIGGGSPLLKYDLKLADGVQQNLKAEFPNLRAYVGMRYIKPFIGAQLQQAIADGCKHILVVPMFPHYCLATTGTALDMVADFFRSYRGPVSVSIIKHWHDCAGYIALLRSRISTAIAQAEPDARKQLLFSAHSIPESIRRSGDPYIEQIEQTCKLAGHVYDYQLSYQSATGPVKWVGPDTLATIDRLAVEHVEQIVIVPISFVSDNIETLYDIDIVFAERCRQLKMKPLIRTPMFNGEPDFVSFMAGLIREKVIAR